MVFVTINQTFFLFCCTEEYNIDASQGCSLSSKSNYFLRYTFPDGTTKDASAQLSSTNVLTSQSPEYDHPCTVQVKLYSSGDHTDDITEFSLDLVSPVEYLFRKFSVNEFEMPDRISNKMTSALLAMSLSYYYVMGEHVEKETRTDEILSTLLNCTQGKMYMNTTRKKKDSTSEESITQFAEHFKLQNTLQYLSGGVSVGDLPVQLPKPMFPPVKKRVELKKPAITPRAKINTLPANDSNIYQVPSNRPLSEYSALQPIVDQDTEYMTMEHPSSCSLLDPVDNNSDVEEEYLFMEQTDSPKKPLKATKSIPFSEQTPKAPLPRPASAENLVSDEVYEFCGSTPTEAAAAAVKRRGPPPKPPVSYQKSRTIDTSRGQPGRISSSDLESSLESSLQEARISSVSKIVKLHETSCASDPLPKKKFNIFHKSKVKRET